MQNEIDKIGMDMEAKLSEVGTKRNGTPSGLQAACNELNKYIMDNNLQPITVGYNVTKKLSH